MCNSRECAAYLKKNTAYGRAMREFRKKWESYGRVTGTITLKRTSESERRALSGIIGTSLNEEDIKLSFKRFEEGLQQTRYAPVDMKEVLEAYFEMPIYTKREKTELQQQRKDSFFEDAVYFFKENSSELSVAIEWITAMRHEKKYGYQILMKEFAQDGDCAENLVRNMGSALISIDKMRDEWKLLAVFAAEISGNPHYFDRGSVAAQLLTHAICFMLKCEEPRNAYEWRECLQSVGILSDTIASMVHALGVHIETSEGLHAGFEAFCMRKEPYAITAENLKSVTAAKADHNKVYVVENEMVFLHLAEKAKESNATLLCTSGQLRMAAFKLLDLLVRGGAEIFYSGDLDPEGMDIADRLWKRYGNAVHLWHMDAGDYEKSISEEMLSERQMAKLERLVNPILRRTAESLRQSGKAGYQEHLLSELSADIANS